MTLSFVSYFLAERCNFIAMSGYCHDMLSVCRLFVCRLYRQCIVTKRLKPGSCSFHENVAQCLNSLPAVFDDKIQGDPWIWKLKVGWGGFRLRNAISRKRCEREHR